MKENTIGDFFTNKKKADRQKNGMAKVKNQIREPEAIETVVVV